MKKGDAVVIPQKFGTYPTSIKLFMRLIKMRGALIAFRDRKGFPSDGLAFDSSIPYIENLRRALATVGIKTSAPWTSPVLRLQSQTSSAVPAAPFILIHPFAANPVRSLPPARWRELMHELVQRYPRFSFLINASGSDVTAAYRMADGLNTVSVLENPEVLELAGAIENAALYIGVDTGPTHLAGVLQQKTVEIGNQSNPTWLATYNPNAMILSNPEHCTCNGDKSGECFVYEDGLKYYRCMYEISDDAIFSAIDCLFNQSRRQ
jgi:ADP-heptose:LPS heptosyltransferase